MSSVVLNGDTSGAITLAVPTVAGTNTATLPAATGTVMVSGNMPAFSVYANTTTTISANTWTKIALNTKTFDTNINFDAVTNYRFTPTVSGYYQINAVVTFTGGNMAPAYIAIYKNGSEYKRGGYFPTTGTYGYQVALPCVQDIVYFNGSTDYVEFYGYQGNTGLTGGSNQTYASGCMIRGA